MSLTTWGAFDDFDRRVSQMLDRFWDVGDRWTDRWGRTRPLSDRFDVGVGHIHPRVEVTENDKQFNVHAELPGVRKEDIHVDVEGDTLTFTGESKQSNDYNDRNVRYSERRYGTYSRTLPVPANVDKDKIQASFKDGVLELSLPKSKTASSKRITVS